MWKKSRSLTNNNSPGCKILLKTGFSFLAGYKWICPPWMLSLWTEKIPIKSVASWCMPSGAGLPKLWGEQLVLIWWTPIYASGCKLQKSVNPATNCWKISSWISLSSNSENSLLILPNKGLYCWLWYKYLWGNLINSSPSSINLDNLRERYLPLM